MNNKQINAAIADAIKQRDQAREHYDRIFKKHNQTEMELKDASEFINALIKENEELLEQNGILMFTAEIMQREINKLQK